MGNEKEKKMWIVRGINSDQADFTTFVEAETAQGAEQKAINDGVAGTGVYAIFHETREMK